MINEAQAMHMLQSFDDVPNRRKRKFIDDDAQKWDTSKPVPYLFNPDDFSKCITSTSDTKYNINTYKQYKCKGVKSIYHSSSPKRGDISPHPPEIYASAFFISLIRLITASIFVKMLLRLNHRLEKRVSDLCNSNYN